MLNKLIYGFVLLLLCSACHSKKKLAAEKKDAADLALTAANATVVKTFELNNLDFHTFTGKAKTKILLNNASNDVTLNIRIQRDKAIWISVTALLGFEVARIMITPDSVKILNKLHGEYIARPFSYIYQYTSQGVTFATVQDLLLANVSSNLLRSNNIQVASSETDVILVGLKDALNFQYGMNKENRPYNFRLVEVGGQQELDAIYSDYANVSGYNFPQKLSLKVEGADMHLDATLNYNKVTFNEQIEMPFQVSERYKVIN